MASSETLIDEPDGTVNNLTVHTAGQTCQYTVDKQTQGLFTSFLKEKQKDDVIVSTTNTEENDMDDIIDIICKYGEGEETQFQFIIVESREIQCETLPDKAAGKSSLKKYFQFYWNLKLTNKYEKNDKYKEFYKFKGIDTYKYPEVTVVVWTNATIDEEKLKKDDITFKPYEGIVYVPDDYNQNQGTGKKIVTLPSNFTEELKSEFNIQFSEAPHASEATEDNDPVVEFCDHLIFYVAPKDRFLNAMSVIGIKSTNPEKKLDNGDFFANTDDVETIIASSNSICHLISDSTALAFIKVAQVLKNTASVTTYCALDLDHLLSYNEEIKIVLELTERFVLAVEIPKEAKDKLIGEQQQVVNAVLNTCMQPFERDPKNVNRKIILIYNTENKDTVNSCISDVTLRANGDNAAVTTDLKLSYDQLNEKSKERIRQTKVKFQGQEVSLQELLVTDGESAVRYNELLTQNVLDKKISNEPMTVGNSLPGLTPEIKNCFITREYEHSSKISAQSIVNNFKGYHMKLNYFDNFTMNDKCEPKCELDAVDGLLSLNLQAKCKNSEGSKKRKGSRKTDHSKLTVKLYPGKEFMSQNVNEVKTVVISTESILFAEIAEKTKKNNPNKQFIEIKLDDHMDAFNELDMSTADNKIDFLVIAGKSGNGSAKFEINNVSKEAKEERSIIVFLDASGEFWLKSKEKVANMVENIKRSRIEQIWINTNPNFKTLFYTDSPDGKDEKEHPEVQSTPIFNLVEDDIKSDAHTFTWENPDEDMIIGNIEARKTVVISGDPGTGKSVALGNIATKIKKQYPAFWVIQIRLSDHTDFFKNFYDKKRIDIDLIEFLSNAEGLAGDSTNIGKVILKHRVEKTGKIIVLLDGLDEVCPLYENQVVTLVKLMSQSQIQQIWITTRPEFKNIIITEHAYSLKDFKADDQEYFIKMYLSHLLNLNKMEADTTETDSSHTGIETCCIDLHNTISNITESKKLIGNALLARMAVEIYFNEIKESWQSMHARQHFNELEINKYLKASSLSRLYEQFIQQRYCFHCEGKWKANTSNAILNMKNKSELFSTAYQRYAFAFLFNDKFNLFYTSNDELAEILTWDLIAIGIISKTSKNINFFHRTFAEYYAAQFMAKMLTDTNLEIWKKDKTPESEKKMKFLAFEHLKEGNKTIRNFMDHFLSHGSEVHEAVLNDNFEEFKKLVVKDKRMARKRDKLGRTPLHLACSYKRRNIADYLLNLDASLVVELDNLGFGPACYAAVRGNEFFMKNILKAAVNYNHENNKHLQHVLVIYNLS